MIVFKKIYIFLKVRETLMLLRYLIQEIKSGNLFRQVYLKKSYELGSNSALQKEKEFKKFV